MESPAAELVTTTPLHLPPVDGQAIVPVMKRLHGLGELLEIRLALNFAAGAPRLEDRGQKQPGENGDDRDHHQQFDERHSSAGEAGHVRKSPVSEPR